MPRKGESIYKRADGRWEARYIHHYKDGVAKYKYLYAHSYNEVKTKRNKAVQVVENVLTPNCKESAKFQEVAVLWLVDIQEQVKESTYSRYNRIVEHYLLPQIGNKKIRALDHLYLSRLSIIYQREGGKNGEGLSAKTTNDILSVLISICNFGIRNGFPCASLSGIRRPQASKSPTKILSKESRYRIEQDLFDEKNTVHLGIMFALYTGMRIGEICGLKKEDIDTLSRTITVKRTVERIANTDPCAKTKTKLIIDEPKSEASKRIIPIPDFLLEYMKNFGFVNNSYLLTGTDKPTEPHQFYLRYKTFMRKYDLEHYTFHALRHTFATQCVEYGFDIKSLSEILGHSNVSTTLSFYVHPTLEQKRRQMELIQPCIRL